ncbi:MAG TPA: hypothetical protein VGO76_12670 [Luteibacter sp.]|jgi:hypothetical protein|nr:hypothetical protein [Luteibacter sp.]
MDLTKSPDALMKQLTVLPSVLAEHKPQEQRLAGKCGYETSSFMMFGAPPAGLCSIGDQPSVTASLEIVDSTSTVASQTFGVMKSEAALSAIQSALEGQAKRLSPESYPTELAKSRGFWRTDAVYARGDDYWVVSHEHWEPGERHSGPDFYMVMHARRAWLEFAMSDLNTCAALPK